MSTLVLCPKCGGQKHVQKPPWVAGDQHEWTSTGTATYPCPLCKGHGYLVTPSRGVALRREAT